jgi:flagellar assembly factor FliW
MKVQTTRFGEIDVPDSDTITLPEGILGFPDATRYVLLEHDSEGTPFKWLQSLEDPNLAFIVIDPHLVVDGYSVEFDEEMQDQMNCKNVDEKCAMMSIVNIPQDNPIEMTVNVRAPIIVHLERREGWQFVLPNDEYPIRHRLFAEDTETNDENKAEEK